MCASCKATIRDDVPNVKCSECSNTYHFGKCAGVTEKSFKSKSKSAKKEWCCLTCQDIESPTSNREGADSELDIKVALASILKKLDSLPELTKKVEEMEQSVKHMSMKFDEFEKQASRQDSEIKALKKRLAELERKDDMNQVVQAQLQQDVNELEYRSRKLNLEIHGLPVAPDENLLSILNGIATKLQVPPLTEADIQTIHRLPARPEKTPGIIARFTRQTTRDSWLKAKNKLRNEEPPIFIQENMTRQNRDLLRTVKEWTKDSGYRFAWHTDGKILIRKDEGTRILRVKSANDLDRLK